MNARIRIGQRRYDETTTVSGVETTPSGGRRFRANLSRVGVFKYKYADGSESREYRPPEEVLKAESVASFAGAPVTDMHPDGMVTPSNYRELARGKVLAPHADGSYVCGSLDVDDAELIAKVDAGERVEVSCGYTADTDPTPGTTPEGEPYDAVQRNIRGNHAALLPPGWGRQGPTVALRLDSDSAIASCITVAPATTTWKDTMPQQIKIDGIECEKNSDTHVSILVKQVDETKAALAVATKRADDAEALVKTTKAEADTQKARADTAEKAADPKTIAKRVDARVGLLSIARQHLGATYLKDAEGAEPGSAAGAVDDDTIIRAVLAKLSPNLDTKAMDHGMLMGALLMGVSQAAAPEVEAPMDAVTEPTVPGDELKQPGAPSAFDSKLAPRGQIGAPNDLTRRADAIDGTDVKTQEQALRERQRADSTRWQHPITPRAPQA